MKPFYFMLAILFTTCLFSAPALAQGSTPTPVPPMIERLGPESMATPAVDRLAPPVMPENPTQADYGAQVYHLVCMVCHGDRGQGLTDEWRGVLDVEDQDCWQSRCHASNHPPEGFVFPKYVPPVVGPLVTNRFATAQELHDYIRTKMPWQAPGMRSEEEYWQLTAHLLRINGVDPGSAPLGPDNASTVYLSTQSSPSPTPSAAAPDGSSATLLILGIALGAGLILVGGIFLGLRAGQPRA
jgi:hypothetical protein